jgi:ABC-type amino acid transport system permease subunit
MNVDKLLRAQVAIILFAAAYLAEVVRGGLQALPAASTRRRTRSASPTGRRPASSSCRRRCAW